MTKTKQHLTASHIKMQLCNMAVTEGFENMHWAASALLLSVFKQQLPCIPPSSHIGRHRGRGGRRRPGLQLSYIFHSRVVNPPPVFNVDIAFGQKKKKKKAKKKSKRKKYIVHTVNKCMPIYLGGKLYIKDLCPKALSQAALLLIGPGEAVIVRSTGWGP